MNAVSEKEKSTDVLSQEGELLEFYGLPNGTDVYNTSIPFNYNGKHYIYGRVEKRSEWASSVTRLFVQDGKCWRLLPDAVSYPLEDPCIQVINGEFVLGGTHVIYSGGKVKTYLSYFFRGKAPWDLKFFTCGPQDMKDIRLVQRMNGKIGVFTRPRSEAVLKQYGSEGIIGYTEIDQIEQLTEDISNRANPLDIFFAKEGWGGCNQVYNLEDGSLGVIGHSGHYRQEDGLKKQIYENISFVFNPKNRTVSNFQRIATRGMFPHGEAKKDTLTECAYASGIVGSQEKNKVYLYSGLSDCSEGRIIIDDPFRAFGGVAVGTCIY